MMNPQRKSVLNVVLFVATLGCAAMQMLKITSPLETQLNVHTVIYYSLR